jgi:hypothetical protein
MTDPDVQAVKGGPSEAAIEASLAAVPPSAVMGCTCRWDENGNPPDDCDCAIVSRQREVVRRSDALRAAYAVDEPRIRADQTHRISEWLREGLRLALSNGNQDHAAIRRLEERFAREFGEALAASPPAEPT